MRLLRFQDGGRAALAGRLGDMVVPIAARRSFPDDAAEISPAFTR